MSVRAYLAECGTTHGYAAHIADGSRPCDSCRRANSEKWREQSRVAALEAALTPVDARVFTIDVPAEDVPALAAAALDRALWLERDDGTGNGSARKALRLRHLHKQLTTWHRTHDSKDTPR